VLCARPCTCDAGRASWNSVYDVLLNIVIPCLHTVISISYVFTLTRTRIHTIHVNIIHTKRHIYECTMIHTNTRMSGRSCSLVCMDIGTCVYVCDSMYVYVYVCICVCMYEVYVCMYLMCLCLFCFVLSGCNLVQELVDERAFRAVTRVCIFFGASVCNLVQELPSVNNSHLKNFPELLLRSHTFYSFSCNFFLLGVPGF